MTTQGVQVAGIRSVGTVGRAGSRASGSGSFADMLSVGASQQKSSPSPQTNSERVSAQRAQASGNPQEAAKNAQETVKNAQDGTKAADTVQNKNESPKIPGNEAGQEGKAEGIQKDVPEEEVAVESSVAGDSGENAGLDTEFVNSLKLFREASKTLEAQKLGELKQAIMDSMQIDEEELEQLLEQLGVNMQSLLQPQLLQQLVVTAECGGDPMGLLTNETAMNDLKDLLAKAQTIQTELLESQKTQEVPESGKTQEIPEMPQKMDAETNVPDFTQVLEGSVRQDREVLQTSKETAIKEDGRPVLEAKTVEEKTGFSFEAVRESEGTAETKEDAPNSRDSGNRAKPGVGSAAEQFLDLVAKAAPTDEAEFAQLTRSEQVRAVADQILEKVRVVLSDKQTSMEISLTPESLGRVTLNLVSRHGALTAHFTAQNQIAKEAIESQMVVLRENLENQGLKVEAIEVTVSNFDFTQNGGAANGGGQDNRQRGRRGISFEEAVNAENMAAGMSEAEQIAADLMERNGNQVDYTA